MVRKSSSLKKNTDLKVDGAYADIVAPPRKKGDPTGQSTALTEQADAISPLAQQAVDTGGMLNYQPQDILGMPTDRPDESGLADTSGQEFVNLPQGTDVEILVELIKEKAPVTRQRF
tara:strand:+ start:898 stop:1248 length:351 start_codon:yes stop_codon:yes gene_type:complete